ncbi:MAG: toxin-activating lysine-acyltransferase [Planctomycetota bacterium]
MTKKLFPDSATFASAMGQAVWLMTLSKDHRNYPISEIERIVSPAVVLQQFKMYFKEKQPIAFLAWAAVSDEVKAKWDAGDYTLTLEDWRSGQNIIIVDCVSPFAKREEVETQFLSGLKIG